MKIKTKKEMNLPELIDWAGKNKVMNQIFRADKQLMNVQFDNHGDFKTYGFTGIDTIFTIEVEEEITEDTKLFLVSRCIGEFGSVHYLYDTTTINSRLKNLPKDCKITHFYIENKDKELVLIWTKEKGLVE